MTTGTDQSAFLLRYAFEDRKLEVSLEGRELYVGRSKDADVCIPHPSISRRHCRLYRSDDGWRVQDLGSLNGTRIRGRADLDGVLTHGDRIVLHELEIEFLDRDAPPLTPFAPPSTMGGTLFRAAADFSGMASGDSGVAEKRLPRVIDLMTRTSEAILRAEDLETTLDGVIEVLFEAFPARRAPQDPHAHW